MVNAARLLASLAVLIALISVTSAWPWKHPHNSAEESKLEENEKEKVVQNLNGDAFENGNAGNHQHLPVSPELDNKALLKNINTKINEDESKNIGIEMGFKNKDMKSESSLAEDGVLKPHFSFDKKKFEMKKIDEDMTSDEEEEIKKRIEKKKFIPKVVYLDPENDDELKLKEEFNDKENERKFKSDDGKLSPEEHLLHKQDRKTDFTDQPKDADEYKLAYQRKKIALRKDGIFKTSDQTGAALKDTAEKSGQELKTLAEKSGSKTESSIDALVYGHAEETKFGKMGRKKKEEKSEEDYEEEYEYEDETTAKEKSFKTTDAEKEAKDVAERIPFPTSEQGFSGRPMGVPPLFLPSSRGKSDANEEATEEEIEIEEEEQEEEQEEAKVEGKKETEAAAGDEKVTFIDVPYRYMPLPLIDPLGYTLVFPWLSVKEVVDKVEDAFTGPDGQEGDEKGQGIERPVEEFKTEVVDIEGKKYLLTTRSMQIGPEGSARAYVSLVSVTPYTEEEEEKLKKAEETEGNIPALMKKKKETEEKEKEIKKKVSVKKEDIKKGKEKKSDSDSDSE